MTSSIFNTSIMFYWIFTIISKDSHFYQSFHKLFAAYFNMTSQQCRQYPFLFISSTIASYFSFCSLSLTLVLVIILDKSFTDAISFFSIASFNGSYEV